MLLFIERWRKELASRFNSFRKLFQKRPAVILCTVTFLYKVKGVFGGGKEQKLTVFSWIEEGTKSHELVKPLFNPPGIGAGQCTISDILILVIPTVKHTAGE